MIERLMKNIGFAVLVLFTNSLDAQTLSFDHGEIEFYTASMISDIEAVTDKAEVNLDVQTGEVEVSVDIKSFEFEYDLMQEHFNEKYLESDKFPKATFKGKIQQDISKGIENEMDVDVSGNLTIHGVTKAIKLKANITKQGEFTVVKTKIPVVFKDYNVEDPSILTKSVAKDVEVKCTFYLKQSSQS